MDAFIEDRSDYVPVKDNAPENMLHRLRLNKSFGSRRRPRMAGWITVIEETPKGIRVKNELYENEFTLKRDAYAFLLALNGFNTIEEAAEEAGLDHNKITGYYSFFVREALVRTGRGLGHGLLSVVGRCHISKRVSGIFSLILSFLFLPVAVLGTVIFMNVGFDYKVDQVRLSVAGYIIMIIGFIMVSVTFHELCHAMSLREVYDAGLMIRVFPGAYVIGKEPKNRKKRIHYIAAGIEGHMLLSGMFGMLSALPTLTVIFSIGFHLNMTLAFLNFLPVIGVGTDGFYLMMEFLKVDRESRNIKSLVRIIVRSAKGGRYARMITVSIALIISCALFLILVLCELYYIFKIISAFLQ